MHEKCAAVFFRLLEGGCHSAPQRVAERFVLCHMSLRHLFTGKSDECHRQLVGFAQGGDWQELTVRVEVEAAREVVRRENSLRRNEGTVRAAAHGDGVGLDAEPSHCLVDVVDGLTILISHGIGDVAVGILDRIGDAAARL